MSFEYWRRCGVQLSATPRLTIFNLFFQRNCNYSEHQPNAAPGFYQKVVMQMPANWCLVLFGRVSPPPSADSTGECSVDSHRFGGYGNHYE
jgi:hypothetical protein